MERLFFLFVLVPFFFSCSGSKGSSANESAIPHDEVIVEIVPDSIPVDSVLVDSVSVDTLSLDTLVVDSVISVDKK